ncbi:MAG: Enoyl-CoA hydratase [Betaproteobacteria bacterium]|nr:Enoyl-CoA hydratase [Betaproteobacteria bacterium]
MIRIQNRASVREIILDRPDRRNALNPEMIASLTLALTEAGAASDCRCIVIKGAGAHFCAGRELAADLPRDLDSVLAYDDAYAAIFERLHKLTKPSIAVVSGYAVAGGFTLAMACDFVIADESAKFGAVEMNNRFPAAVNTAVLSNLLGPRRALELLLLGEITSARTLFDMGLINRLAADADELAAVETTLTAQIAALDPAAVRLTKETHRAACNMPLADALTLGKQLNALLLASGRIDEASRAFTARRKP